MKNTTNGKILWLLDNGHGIDTPNKKSPRLPDGRQFLEYRFNREVVSKMLVLLKRQKLSSIQLVPEEKDISILSRIKRANAYSKLKPCVLVSVHSNAFGDVSRFSIPRGIASYYYETSQPGRMIAEVFQENLVQVTGWKDRGIRRSEFLILRGSRMPAILTETGFYTNREQLEYLLDSDWRERIAEAHVEAITEIEEMGPAFFQPKPF